MFGVVFRGHPDLRRDPDAGGVRGLPAAPRLPDRRRAGAVHAQRARDAAVVRVSGRPGSRGGDERARAGRRRDRRAHAGWTAARPTGRAGAADDQLRPAPPRDARGAAAARDARGRGGARAARPYVGYVHTGIEKNCEDKSYWKVIPLVERMDYLAYYFNALAFCMCGRAAARRAGAARARSTCA